MENNLDCTGNRWRRLGYGLPLLFLTRLRADDQIAYRHEFYEEHNGRTAVAADAFLVQKILAPWLDLKVEGVYDAISGATPTGLPPPNNLVLRSPVTGLTLSGASIRQFVRGVGADAVSGASRTGSIAVESGSDLPVAQVRDIRRAIQLSAGFTYGAHRVVPQLSYSEEIDYVSKAFGFNYAFEFNNKNTTLGFGWSHTADRIIPNEGTFLQQVEHRDSDDFLAGITQLLGPKTILTVNGTVGYGSGYFNDPYKAVVFENSFSLQPATLGVYGENRPSHRARGVALVSLTQAITPLQASVEGSYRYAHDSFEISAHTLSLDWHQKVARWLVLSPTFRYYRQSEASFYAPVIPGHPTTAPAAVPEHYSSDYRLSELHSFSYGIQADIRVWKGLEFNLGYQRYDLKGLDGVTSPDAYPTADILTVGATFRF